MRIALVYGTAPMSVIFQQYTYLKMLNHDCKGCDGDQLTLHANEMSQSCATPGCYTLQTLTKSILEFTVIISIHRTALKHFLKLATPESMHFNSSAAATYKASALGAYSRFACAAASSYSLILSALLERQLGMATH